MTTLNLALLVACGLVLIGLACLWADECRIRWPWVNRAKMERYGQELLDTIEKTRALIPIDLPSADVIDLARHLEGATDLKAAAYKQRLTKRNNVNVKLAAAYLVRLIREKGEQDSQIYQACASLVELGCVDPDDTEGLRLAGDRFAIEGEAHGDVPELPSELRPGAIEIEAPALAPRNSGPAGDPRRPR